MSGEKNTAVMNRYPEGKGRDGGRIYPRLAVTGIIKNHRTYVPYLLACIGMVMMYYILHFLMQSERVAAMKGGGTLQMMLSYGSGVFVVFIVIFLFYTHSFLIRNRKREFGLYNILGMGKWNLGRILVWESVIIAAVSLACGLFCGILFSKLAELCMAQVLDGQISMSFSIEWMPARSTVLMFAAVFVLILLNSLFQVGKSKPIDLLHSTSVGEKPPRANWILAVLGAVVLIAAYYISVSIDDPMSAFILFFVAVGMVIIATYLLFIAGSVVLCKILQKNKKYYYKANHFVSVSSMIYRMKRNGAGLASICILSTMILVALSSTTCMYFGNEDRLESRYPKQIQLYVNSFDENYWQQLQETADEVLRTHGLEAENGISYLSLDIGGYLQEDQVILDESRVGMLDYSNVWGLYFIPLDDYNRIMGAAETLEEGEVILYVPKGKYKYDTLSIEGCDTWKVKKYADKFTNNGEDSASILNSLFIFVPDMAAVSAIYQVQMEIYGDAASEPSYYYGFDTLADEEEQQQIAAEIGARLDGLKQSDENFPAVRQNCRAEQRADFYALYGGMFVLGILLSIVFLAATVLIMYYKQVTEGYEDQAKFDIMQRVGMTKREIRSSIRSQMFTVFLAPLLLAGLHTAFAFPIVQKLLILFGVINTRLLIETNIACFLVFALFYTIVYNVTSRSYYRIVSGGRE